MAVSLPALLGEKLPHLAVTHRRRQKNQRGLQRALTFMPVAQVAQSVEQLIRNEQVAGSIPALGSIKCAKPSGPRGVFVLRRPRRLPLRQDVSKPAAEPELNMCHK